MAGDFGSAAPAGERLHGGRTGRTRRPRRTVPREVLPHYCLLNRYRSGADSVGLHADDEPDMGPVIGSLSLGATRTFRIRHHRTKEKRSFEVGNGTLIVMAGTMQQYWKHEVLKTDDPVGERINLTFRTLTQSER